MSNRVQLKIVDKLKPVFGGRATTRCAWGGRGSGKTRSFATMCVYKGFEFGNRGISGTILCARQFQNSLADSSLVELKTCIEEYPIFGEYYDVGKRYIQSKDGRIQFQFIGLEHNISSVKSMGNILICWVDEAQNVTGEAWDVLLPTLRPEGEGWNSELWVTWNPLHKNCPVEDRFRYSDDPDIKKAEVNWVDNSLFPSILGKRRERDLIERPEKYGHVWNGEYATYADGAYYAREMIAAKESDPPRITTLFRDPNMELRAFWDLGGTGRHSDATAIWIAQFVGQHINVLDFYEMQGEPLGTHISWLRANGYDDGLMVLPHDGVSHDKVYDVSFESALQEAGFRTLIIPNQGKGAVGARIEAARRLFPRIWFDKQRTEKGREALEWYHEKRIECDGHFIGRGANHDWSSHAADAFGMMCISYEMPRNGEQVAITAIQKERNKKSWYSWMAV